MKKLIHYLGFSLFAVSILSTSCEKDKPLKEAMIGKWGVEYAIRYIYHNNNLSAEYKEYIDQGQLTVQFVEGGNGIYTENGDDYLFSWVLDGSSITITNLFEVPAVWDLKMEGDLLVWSFPETDPEDPSITYEIAYTAKRIN